jgi:hypothetical protein
LLGASEWREGLNEVIKWLEVLLTLIIAFEEAQRGRPAWLVAAILLTGLVQAGVGLWQYQWRGSGPDSFRLAEGVYRAYGAFEQPNPFGGFLGLMWLEMLPGSKVAGGSSSSPLPPFSLSLSFCSLAFTSPSLAARGWALPPPDWRWRCLSRAA